MDPRLDSGMAIPLDEPTSFKFDPFVSLLPEEVCWIMDRSLAAEVMSRSIFRQDLNLTVKKFRLR